MNSATQRAQLRRVANYVAANLALRRAIHQNARDSRTDEQGDKICYFVDANIVRWYLNPLENFNLVAPLMRPDDPERCEVVEFASNVIAAHYVFSKFLVGAREFAPFLTPFHADELHESLEREIILFREQAKQEVVTPMLRRAADDLVSRLASFKQLRSMPALSALFEAFTNVLKHAYGSISFRRSRTRRLFLDRRVVRASEYDDFNLDQSYLEPSKLKAWEDLLIQCGKSAHETLKLSRDASSLCLLERLNHDAATDNRRIRFVMISADSSLHDAVDTWRHSENLIEITQFDFLRHPRQYIPIINLNSMRADAEQTIKGFSELMNSVDDISFSVYSDSNGASAASAREAPSHFPERLGRGIREWVPEEELRNLAPKVDMVSVRWTYALETSVLMNTELVLGIADDYVAERIKPLAEGEIDDVLQQQILDDIHQIASGHIDFAARGQLAAQLKSIRRSRTDGMSARSISRHARSPALVRFAVPKALVQMAKRSGESAPRDLTSFVNEFIFSQDPLLLEEFEQAVEDVSGIEAATIACILAFRLSRWEQARYLAERLIHAHERDDPTQAEFEYLRVVTDRFSGLSLEDLQRNRGLLEARMRTCRENGKDEYGFIRAVAEAGAQCLFYGYSQALIARLTHPIAENYVWSTIYEADAFLSRGRRALVQASSSGRLAEIDPKMVRQLRAHILANSLAAYFFIELRPIPVADGISSRERPPPDGVAEELFKLTASDEKAFRLAEFYALCARKHLGRWGKEEETRMRILLSVFSQDKTYFEEIDRREVSWLSNVLGLSLRVPASDPLQSR
jgi:hypothetical protein